MFCFQCEQTAGGTGCAQKAGVCGKNEETAALQDLLVHAVKGIAQYAHRARQVGVKDAQIDRYVMEGLFTTVTNVNFDPERLETLLRKAGILLDKASALYKGACDSPEDLIGPATWRPATDRAGLLQQAAEVGVLQRRERFGEDVGGLQELLVYGLKGMAAYADHAAILGRQDDSVYGFTHEALDFLTGEKAGDVNELVGMVLKCGEVNLKVMEQRAVLLEEYL